MATRRSCTKLLGASPDKFGRSARRSGSGVPQLIAGEREWPLLFGSLPIREESVLDLKVDSLISLIDRVCAPVGISPLHRSFVLLRSPFHAVVRREFGTAGTQELQGIAAVSIEDENALWIVTHHLDPS